MLLTDQWTYITVELAFSCSLAPFPLLSVSHSSSVAQTERRVFTNFHRQVFCWLDLWYGLTIEDIRRIEDETKRALDEVRACMRVCSFVFVTHELNSRKSSPSVGVEFDLI